MTAIEEDKESLKILVKHFYVPVLYYYTIEAKEVELEIKTKMEGLKAWADKLIDEKMVKKYPIVMIAEHDKQEDAIIITKDNEL